MKLPVRFILMCVALATSGCNVPHVGHASNVRMQEIAWADDYGNAAWMRNDFKEAAKYYEVALDSEKSQYERSKSLYPPTEKFIRIINRLGVSYALTGRLEESKSTLEYGLSVNPAYPIFHYNLACAYAEMGDLPVAISHLESAARYKSNMLQGDRWPDVRNDESFKKYRDDPLFVKFLESEDKSNRACLNPQQLGGKELCACWGLKFDAKVNGCVAAK